MLYYLNDEQLKKLFNVIKHSNKSSGLRDRDLALFSLTFFCGLRASEVETIKRNDLNTKFWQLQIQGKKGGKLNVYTLEGEIKENVNKWVKRLPTDYDGPLFGSKGLSRKNLDKLIKYYGEVAGLPKFLCHMHILRHTCGTKLREKGFDHVAIANWLRHSDPSSALQYMHLKAGELDTAGKALSNVFGQKINWKDK